MLPRSINIGPLAIHLYGVAIAVAIYLGWLFAQKRAYLYRIPQKIFEDPILLLPLGFGIIGARFYHVLHLWSFYQQNPIKIFAIASGGLGIWGALIGIILGFWIVAKIKNLDALALLDLIAPSLFLGQAIGRIGNFINQEAFGPPTGLPWGIYIEPQNRPIQFATSDRFHPTFFYEAILDLIFFFIILKFSQRSTVRGLPRQNSHLEPYTYSIEKAKDNNKRGQLFSLYLISYSTSRFIAEFWRIDTWTVGTLKVAHILALTTATIGLYLFLKSSRHFLRG